VLFVCALLVQYASGAFGSTTRPDNPDEPARIVTGLMVRDYLVHGLGQPPMAFAREYYVHYPKVALAHWPPLFYVVQALSVGPGASQAAALLTKGTGIASS
jgi:hypothetical protein